MYLRSVFFFLFPLFLSLSCATSQTANNSTINNSNSRALPGNVFFLDANADGVFDQQIDLAKSPMHLPSKMDWTRAFYKDINFPPAARKRGVSGYLTLDVLVDEMGQVQDVGIAKSLSADCDAEAIRAYWASTQPGLTPLVMNGETKPFRMHVSVGFWLQ